MIHPGWLALFYAASEVFISTVLRSGNRSQTDRGSLRAIWIVVNVSVIGGIASWKFLPQLAMPFAESAYRIGLAMFIAGLALRWYSIAYLGRFFTVDVTVRADQSVVDTGPYRFVRHPSYSGSLLAFVGLGFCFANFATLAWLSIPTTAVFLYRIRVEEAALLEGLGESYREYLARTRRLIPFIY